MSFELRQFAAEQFPHITDRKQREQAGEHRLVRMYFGDKAEGFFVDVGANDPVVFSQTHHLEQEGWTGLLIEPTPELCDKLRKHRPNSTVIEAACVKPGDEGEASFNIASDHQLSSLQANKLDFPTDVVQTITVRADTLNAILEQNPPADGLDFLSIDVEGAQLDVLRGVDLTEHRPKLLLIEDHLTSLRNHWFIKRQGYRLVKRTGLNNWYIPARTPFALSSRRERFALWRKVYLRTWWRSVRFRVRRLIVGTVVYRALTRRSQDGPTVSPA